MVKEIIRFADIENKKKISLLENSYFSKRCRN